jgi:hypothetical protein
MLPRSVAFRSSRHGWPRSCGLGLTVDPVTFPRGIVRDLLPAQGKLQLQASRRATKTLLHCWRPIMSMTYTTPDVTTSLTELASGEPLHTRSTTELRAPLSGADSRNRRCARTRIKPTGC